MGNTEQHDMVNEPPHYQSDNGIECIDAIEAAVADLQGFEGYCTGNAIKYLWRWKKKGGAQDLEKARWYVERLLDHISHEQGSTQKDALLEALRVRLPDPGLDAYDQVEAHYLRGGYDRG